MNTFITGENPILHRQGTNVKEKVKFEKRTLIITDEKSNESKGKISSSKEVIRVRLSDEV